jgi:hypothetical protein
MVYYMYTELPVHFIFIASIPTCTCTKIHWIFRQKLGLFQSPSLTTRRKIEDCFKQFEFRDYRVLL